MQRQCMQPSAKLGFCMSYSELRADASRQAACHESAVVSGAGLFYLLALGRSVAEALAAFAGRM